MLLLSSLSVSVLSPCADVTDDESVQARNATQLSLSLSLSLPESQSFTFQFFERQLAPEPRQQQHHPSFLVFSRLSDDNSLVRLTEAASLLSLLVSLFSSLSSLSSLALSFGTASSLPANFSFFSFANLLLLLFSSRPVRSQSIRDVIYTRCAKCPFPCLIAHSCA